MEGKLPIKDMFPATLEFQAVFVNSDNVMMTKPVICWEVVRQRGEEPIIKGMVDGDAGIIPCDDDTFIGYSFVGYAGPGENPVDLSAEASFVAEELRDEEEDYVSQDDASKPDGEDDNDELDGIIANLNEGMESQSPEDMMKHLPVVLSQLSVLVREVLESGETPKEWEQWVELMKKFASLTAAE